MNVIAMLGTVSGGLPGRRLGLLKEAGLGINRR